MPSPLRVLLVDDNPDDRVLVARELEAEYGALAIEEVIDAADLERAIEPTYDLVITDYQHGREIPVSQVVIAHESTGDPDDRRGRPAGRSDHGTDRKFKGPFVAGSEVGWGTR